jgi:hypothetical protein
MEFTVGEIVLVAVIALILAALVGGYMVYTRKKGLM